MAVSTLMLLIAGSGKNPITLCFSHPPDHPRQAISRLRACESKCCFTQHLSFQLLPLCLFSLAHCLHTQNPGAIKKPVLAREREARLKEEREPNESQKTSSDEPEAPQKVAETAHRQPWRAKGTQKDDTSTTKRRQRLQKGAKRYPNASKKAPKIMKKREKERRAKTCFLAFPNITKQRKSVDRILQN